VLRGGSWNNNADNCRTANRNWNDPDDRNDNVGFRVVWVALTFFSQNW
jgi:formylglycine-generating enzyme required for sulfatase activity